MGLGLRARVEMERWTIPVVLHEGFMRGGWQPEPGWLHHPLANLCRTREERGDGRSVTGAVVGYTRTNGRGQGRLGLVVYI